MNLMEQPLLIVAAGVAVLTVLVGGFIQTGKRGLLYGAGAMILLTVGMLALERSTITPREAVKATLYVIANEIEQNDLEGLLKHISAGRPNLVDEAKKYMSLVTVEEVDIKKNLKVDLHSERGMYIAEASFNAVIRGSDKRGFLDKKRPIPRFFKVRFKLEDGSWKVRSYEMSDPREGLRGT